MAESNSFGRSESFALNSRTFAKFAGEAYSGRMTVRGAVEKTAMLLAILAASAAWSWLSMSQDLGASGFLGWLAIPAMAALVLGLITTLYMRTAPFTALLYALLEGIVLGGLSAVFEAFYPGIVIQAVLLSFGTLFSLLLIYRAGGFYITGKFWPGVIAATMAIALTYLLDLSLSLIGLAGVNFIHQSGLIGIGLSLCVVIIAALNLVLDFDLIESGACQGAPKCMVCRLRLDGHAYLAVLGNPEIAEPDRRGDG